MNIETLHQYAAALPGSFGDHIGRRMAVNAIAAGSVNYAAALVGLLGPGAIGALVDADAPPAMLRPAIEYAVLFRYRELPLLDRATFAAWCRQAGFTLPAGSPETVDIYRGTMGCSPADAALGWHWSLRFEDAAFYGCRFANADLIGVVILHARVPREAVAAVVSGSAHQEVVPAEAPTVFEIITDKQRISAAAINEAQRMQALMAQGGWHDTGTQGTAGAVAMVARARMAAAGVPLGTAIVA